MWGGTHKQSVTAQSSAQPSRAKQSFLQQQSKDDREKAHGKQPKRQGKHRMRILVPGLPNKSCDWLRDRPAPEKTGFPPRKKSPLLQAYDISFVFQEIIALPPRK
ncbi:hypothetical protein NDU88_004332 [Pleurodeles waltl]|uniref:Uncharacterized protein n=1 Tax=Pleurodeles waltl TaxID=8319 RepID=A0AAV7QI20_PLEWA|nr:hypothetical protein NDU88_004332 [Pleurodeles waltl]